MREQILYGAALGAAGALAASGLWVRAGEEMRGRLGLLHREVAARAPTRVGTGALAERAAAHGWVHGSGSYAAALVGAGLFGAAAGFRLAGPVGGAAGLLAAPRGFEVWLERRLQVRRAGLEGDLRDWVRALAAASRAGLSLRRALSEAGKDIGPALRPYLDRALSTLHGGATLEEVLDGLGADVGSADARLAAAVLTVHLRIGGDLAPLLDDVAETVARRLVARRDLRAITAQGRASGAVLALLPVAFVGLLSGMGGNGLGAFYRTPAGSGLLALGLALQGIGFMWIRRIVGRSG